jgi:hypothetical protein
VPPMSTMLRQPGRNEPECRERTSSSLMGSVPAEGEMTP